MDAFTQFEHEGWERVAGEYDSVWSSSTRQFIAPLLNAAEVREGMEVLDVGCGPGYVSAAASKRGATARGVDFSQEMVGIARRMFPRIEFAKATRRHSPSPIRRLTGCWQTLPCFISRTPSALAPKRTRDAHLRALRWFCHSQSGLRCRGAQNVRLQAQLHSARAFPNFHLHERAQTTEPI